MYFVQQKYFNNGQVEARIWLESECYGMDKSNRDELTHDEYWDSFKTFEEAEEFLNEALSA